MRRSRYTGSPGAVPPGTGAGLAVYLPDRTAPEGRPLDSTETDRVLVERARGGDLAAYEVLVRRHQAVAYRTAAAVAGPADAEDAVQEAFVKAHALDRFELERSFRPWLLRIVVNEAKNARRSTGRRLGLALRTARLAWTGPLAPQPEQGAVDAENRAGVLALVDGLPEPERQVLVCRYLLDPSEAETAEVLGIPAGTAKSRAARGLARLRSAAETAPLLSPDETGVDHHA